MTQALAKFFFSVADLRPITECDHNPGGSIINVNNLYSVIVTSICAFISNPYQNQDC